MRHHTTTKSFTLIVFTFPPQHVLRGGFLGTSCQSRDRVPPFYGILINTDVGNPTAPLITALGRQASFTRQVGTHNRIRPYKGTRIHLFYLRLLPLFPIHLLRTRAPAPKPALPTSTFSSNVRSGRQVDGLLRHGGPSQKAKEGRILVQGHRAPASRGGAASPHPKAP